MVLVYTCIEHFAGPVLGLQQQEATAIHQVFANGPLKVVALSSTQTSIKSDLFPILMACDLNTEHLDWISRLTASLVLLLPDYASRNSCLICLLDSPAMVSYQPNTTPDILDIVVDWL